jgi:excisionase family DNA binding protein
MKQVRAQARPRNAEGDETESVPEAAIRHGVNPRTIRRYISEGRLPAYRLGPRLIRVKVVDSDQLLRPIYTTGSATG